MNRPNFQVVIVSAAPAAPAAAKAPGGGDKFEVNQHSGASKVIDKIDALDGIWDQAVEKLTKLAEKSQLAASASKFELGSIEFHIGIEAGVAIGLVTKGEASVTLTFERKRPEGEPTKK
jgi:hypothetical protein